MTTKRADPERPARIKKIADETANALDGLQRAYGDAAHEAGYARDVIRDTGNAIARHPDSPVFVDTEKALMRFREYVRKKEVDLWTLPTSLAASAYSFGTSTGSLSSLFPKELDFPRTNPPPFWPPTREKEYGDKLHSFDPEIGKEFKSVWEIFYGTRDNPERGALGQMRNVFDHFFSKLSPDSEVRKSKFFEKKKGKIPDQVSRKERIYYAAHTHIKDPDQAELLSSQSEYVLAIYKALNKLHKRGVLDRESVSKVLTAMRSVIENWVDSLNLPTKSDRFDLL